MQQSLLKVILLKWMRCEVLHINDITEIKF